MLKNKNINCNHHLNNIITTTKIKKQDTIYDIHYDTTHTALISPISGSTAVHSLMCTQIVQEIADFCTINIFPSVNGNHNIDRNIYCSRSFTQMNEKCT